RLIFPDAHPYHHPPAGDVDGIGAIAADEVRRFGAIHFAPQHARLVLVGDISVRDAAALVTKIFGALPSGTETLGAIDAKAPLIKGPRSRRVSAPVASAHTFLAWPIAGFAQDEWYLASLLVRGAATGRSSPLAEALVDQMGLAS